MAEFSDFFGQRALPFLFGQVALDGLPAASALQRSATSGDSICWVSERLPLVGCQVNCHTAHQHSASTGQSSLLGVRKITLCWVSEKWP